MTYAEIFGTFGKLLKTFRFHLKKNKKSKFSFTCPYSIHIMLCDLNLCYGLCSTTLKAFLLDKKSKITRPFCFPYILNISTEPKLRVKRFPKNAARGKSKG